MEAGSEFQFFKIIGTNVLANEVVRHFCNLTAKECWESALWGELLTLTYQSTCRDSIYSKGKVQRHIFGEPASSSGYFAPAKMTNCRPLRIYIFKYR